MGTYGRTFTLSTSNKGLEAPTSGPGGPQTYTGEAGFIAYYEICDKIKNGGMKVVQDKSVKAPYGYAGNFWVGYDDASSLEYKVQSLIKGKGLAGAMFWALDLDDFDGSHCDAGKYPLINAVKSALEIIPTEQPLTTNPPTAKPPTTKPPTTMPPTTKPPTTTTTAEKPSSGCHGVPPYDKQPGIDNWCTSNCALGNCPSTHCSCN